MNLLRAVVMMVAVLSLCPSAYAGASATFNLNYSRTESFDNGVRRLRTDRFNQNYYLGLQRSVTPMFSYRLFLRANLTDTQTTEGGARRDSYHRGFEPTLDLFLRNHVYSASAGYRRTEGWSTARLTDRSRVTTEFYYSRFNLTPWELPSLTLEADRRKNFDYGAVRQVDNTTDRYSASSFYRYFYKGIDASYNMTFTRTESETPLSIVNKSISDVFSGLFALGYSKSLFDGKAGVSTRYQANYSRSDIERFVTQTGAVVFERTPFQGLYALGVAPAPGNVNTLGTQNSFVDNDTATGIGGIDIATGLYHNVGLQVLSSLQAVDRLYVYVKADGDVTTDTNLSNAANWMVYTSNDNATWTSVAISSVAIITVDALNNVYRYELTFTAQTAAFYKAINQATVNAIGVTSALVSEVEAHGTDIVPSTGRIEQVGTSFTQGWNFNVNMRPAEKLDVSLNYYINQLDQSPPSIADSMQDFAENIVSKTRKTDGNLRRNVSRSYGPSATWRVHRLLTTNASVSRSEIFDNLGTLDSSSNNYSLSFNSSPVQNLDATLSLIRSDSFTFGDRENTTDQYLLSVGSRLYREVNMVVDIGHTESEAHKTDVVTRTNFVRGSIDARLTSELFTNFGYGLTKTSEAATDTTSQEASVVVAYRLGRLMSISSNFRFSDSDGATTTSEGVTIDWLPVRVVRLNLSYQHSDKPGDETTDSISSFVRWTIKRFLDLQVTYTYSRAKTPQSETENRSIAMTLNGRF